jgi:hypothetical protein
MCSADSGEQGGIQPDRGGIAGGFGFGAERVNERNCVFRVRDLAATKPGGHRFRTLAIVGTLEDVRGGCESLRKEFAPR